MLPAHLSDNYIEFISQWDPLFEFAQGVRESYYEERLEEQIWEKKEVNRISFIFWMCENTNYQISRVLY